MTFSPLFEGLKPKLDSIIACSISLINPLSKGWIEIVCESGVVILDAWDNGVLTP